MSITPIRRPHLTRPPEQLSPARSVLADTLARLDDLHQRIRELQEIIAQADEMARREAAALQGIEDIGAAEQDDWRIWAASGRGEPPAPRTIQRENAVGLLSDCRRASSATLLAANSVRPQAEELGHRIADLARHIPALVADVLLEEAERLHVEHEAAMHQVLMSAAGMEGLRDRLLNSGFGAQGTKISLMLRGWPRSNDPAHQRALREAQSRQHDRWAVLADALASDATARVAED